MTPKEIGQILGETITARITQKIDERLAEHPSPVVNFDIEGLIRAIVAGGSREHIADIPKVIASLGREILSAIVAIEPAAATDVTPIANGLDKVASAITALQGAIEAIEPVDLTPMVDGMADNTAAIRELEAAYRADRTVIYDSDDRVTKITVV